MALLHSRYFSYGSAFICLLGTAVLAANLIVLWQARPYIVSEPSALRPAQTVIVLGAGVYQDGSLTPILKERVERAISLYRAGIADKILVSGDNGSRDYNEVSPVHVYLVERGIPAADIFLDYAGFDTYDTMYRARAVFQVRSAVVVTQSFHLPRAIYIARDLGIEAQGIPPQNDLGSWRNSFREAFSRVKAVLDVLLKDTPTYLGRPIPITGDGRESVGE